MIETENDDQIMVNLGGYYYEKEKYELVGYIPEQDATIFVRLMDMGKMLFAVVKSISHTNSGPLIEINIYLQDF